MLLTNPKKSNRTSFTRQNSEHIYEIMLEHFQDGCFECQKIKKYLEDFIGKKYFQKIKNNVRKNGYCK